VPPSELDVDPATAATLLEAARVAAHESGDRRNAPLRCFLLGRAASRTAQPLDVLAAAIGRRAD
jgi:hypothetical protein